MPPADALSLLLTRVAVREATLKAKGAPQQAEIARLTVALERQLWGIHRKAAARAIQAAVAALPGPGGDRGVERVAGAALRAYNASFVKPALQLVRQGLGIAYALGKKGMEARVGRVRKDLPGASLAASFNLPDTRAVAALLAPQTLWVGEHAEAALADQIRASAREILELGEPGEVAGKKLRATLREKFGLVPRDGAPPGALAVPETFRGTEPAYMRGLATHIATTGRVVGAVRSLEELGGAVEFEIMNPMDSRTCPRCRLMNGKRFKVSQGAAQVGRLLGAGTPDKVKAAQPWLKVSTFQGLTPRAGHISAQDSAKLAAAGVVLPPFHFHCFPGGTVVQGAIVGGSRAWYEGQAVELRTLEGRRLTVTPNHPVLTASGFLPAGELRVGDQLVGYGPKPWVESLGAGAQGDEHEEPARAEDVFRALAQRGGTASVTPAPDDFHGEAVRFSGEVQVVGAYRDLLAHRDAPGLQERGQLIFEGTSPGEPVGVGPGTLQPFVQGVFPAPASSPRPSALALQGDGVGLHGLPLLQLRIGAAANLHPRVPEVSGQGDPARAGTAGGLQLVRELLEGHPGEVAVDEVAEVRIVDLAAHVYDFQAVSGYIVAQGIVISNCRCTIDVVPESISATDKHLARKGVKL